MIKTKQDDRIIVDPVIILPEPVLQNRGPLDIGQLNGTKRASGNSFRAMLC